MIVYKRKLSVEDLINLNDDEQLVYYKNENNAITIDYVNDFYLVREKQISNNELIEEVTLKSVNEVMEFVINN